MHRTFDDVNDDLCKWCGGLKADRNPMGAHCDHLYWPDNLTDEAKRANGYTLRTAVVWTKDAEAKEDPPF